MVKKEGHQGKNIMMVFEYRSTRAIMALPCIKEEDVCRLTCEVWMMCGLVW